MFEGKLRRARTAIGLALVASFEACAEGVELGAGDIGRGAVEEDAGEFDASDALEEPHDDASEGDPLDAGTRDDASAPSDAHAALDARADASELSDADAVAASASDAALDARGADAAATYSCPSCALKVQWNTSSTAASTQTITGYLKLTNTGSAPIALLGVTVRYWLRDAMAEGMVIECYHWDDGKGANKCTRANDAGVNSYTSLGARVGSGANDLRYVELTFPEAAGELAAGGTEPGALQLAFHLPSYLPMTQTDDPSFDALLSAASASMLFDAPKISAYLGGKLAWGVEP